MANEVVTDALTQRRPLIATMLLALAISLASALLLHPNDDLFAITQAAVEGHFPFLGVVLLGTFITHVWSLAPEARQRNLLACLVLEGGSQLLGGGRLGIFAGAVAISTRIIAAARAGNANSRREHLATLIDGLAFPLFALTSPGLIGTVAALRTDTFDAYLAHVDAAFPAVPSLVVHDLFMRLPPLHTASAFAYGALAPLFCILYAESLRAHPNAPPTALRAWVLAAILGCALYTVFPSVGPLQFFGGVFPETTSPHLAAAPTAFFPALHLPRNGMPSLHTAWSLLAMMHARPLRVPFRIFGVALFVLTELATLGLGEHWFVDLVVAWPFAVGVDLLVRPGLPALKRASLSAIAGLAVALWLVALRFLHDALAQSYIALLALAALTAGLAVALDHAGRARVTSSSREAHPR